MTKIKNKTYTLIDGSVAYNYKDAVGGLWEQIGRLQFNVLCEEGLDPNKKLLDIGCGSLRAGVHLIPFLNKGNYFGIEPISDLVKDALKVELAEDVVRTKLPAFDYNSSFDLGIFNTVFDYLLAQSILTHTCQQQVEKIFKEASSVMHSRSKFYATYFRGEKNYSGSSWTNGQARYTFEYLRYIAAKNNLVIEEKNYQHPREQKWLLIQKKK